MDKSVQITLIIVGAFVVLALIGISLFLGIVPTNTVTGNGEATVEVVPDLVVLYFNVETKADTASETKDENAEIVEEIITALLKERFDRDEIVTQSFSVNPEYDWSNKNREIIGYVAMHRLKVELSTEEVEKIGETIDAAVDAGASISYINFELSQELQNEYKAEALKLAAEDAKIKAESIAEGLDKRLGRIVSTKDSSFNYYPWRLYEVAGGMPSVEDAKQATTDIQPGEQEITARVSVIYKLR